ncbi:MAG: cation transporter, partial [Candidatus Omnitrophica bacterium]|nr:cation transporter [Candidatus Omnitrophota bacterium]
KGYEFLHYADTIAAIIVGVIVIYISIRLGIKAIRDLLDATPVGLEEKIIAAVKALPGVIDCHKVRIRFSGPQPFVDLHVLVDGNKPLREVHRLTEDIERVTQQFIANADVTVHPEPN